MHRRERLTFEQLSHLKIVPLFFPVALLILIPPPTLTSPFVLGLGLEALSLSSSSSLTDPLPSSGATEEALPSDDRERAINPDAAVANDCGAPIAALEEDNGDDDADRVAETALVDV